MPKGKANMKFKDIVTKHKRNQMKGLVKKRNNKMNKATEVNHLARLEPLPQEASTNPVNWATDHLETLIPQAAKEYEYALKFGDSKTRLEIAGKIMAMKGLSDRGPQVSQVVPAIQLIVNQGPLPFQSVDQPKSLPVTIDSTAKPIK